jgi:AraC-like DNA-binding protein
MMADSRSHHIASSLPFGKKQAYVHSDVNAFTDYISNSIETIQNYAPLEKAGEFFYLSSSIDIGGLKIAASFSSPSAYKVKETQGFYFFVPTSGSAGVASDGMKYICESGKSAYFSPEMERAGQTSELSMLQMSIDEKRLLSTARGMLDDGAFLSFRRQMSRPHVLPMSANGTQYDPIFGHLCKLIDDADMNEDALRMIGIDDVFYRTLVLMIGAGADFRNLYVPESMIASTAVDTIAEYISAHYNEPITMTKIEKLAGASSRNIVRAFHKKYNCSPMQWLYRYRLDMLKIRLEHPQIDDNVTRLAYDCGFTRLGALSKFYAETFGEKPSETLRRSRRR